MNKAVYSSPHIKDLEDKIQKIKEEDIQISKRKINYSRRNKITSQISRDARAIELDTLKNAWLEYYCQRKELEERVNDTS